MVYRRFQIFPLIITRECVGETAPTVIPRGHSPIPFARFARRIGMGRFSSLREFRHFANIRRLLFRRARHFRAWRFTHLHRTEYPFHFGIRYALRPTSDQST